MHNSKERTIADLLTLPRLTTLCAASLFAASALVALPACEEGAFEDAGEEVDDALEDAGDAIEDAGDEIDDALDDDSANP